MKRTALLCAVFAAAPMIAHANCGSVPLPPIELEQPSLTTEQQISIEASMEGYFASVDTYKNCVNDQILTLAPADAPESYFDSTEYQNDFSALVQLTRLAEQNMSLAIERYNYLLEVSE